MDRNIVEHECINTECNNIITLKWNKRKVVCECGRGYRYNPTGGATMKPSRKAGTDWLKNSRLRKSRKG